MAKIIFNDDKEFELEDGSDIKQVCEDAGVAFSCDEGVCGICLIEVVEGMENLSKPTQEEIDFLGDVSRDRLACQCKIKKGTVKIKF